MGCFNIAFFGRHNYFIKNWFKQFLSKSESVRLTHEYIFIVLSLKYKWRDVSIISYPLFLLSFSTKEVNFE